MNAAAVDAEPLGVWDCNDPDNAYFWHWREASEWAQEHIVDAIDTYRAEFYLVDVPFAVLYRVAFNEHGNAYIDPATGEAARAEPVIQVLDELPPEHLLRQ